jgi:hypothetical protein
MWVVLMLPFQVVAAVGALAREMVSAFLGTGGCCAFLVSHAPCSVNNTHGLSSACAGLSKPVQWPEPAVAGTNFEQRPQGRWSRFMAPGLSAWRLQQL